MRRFHCCGYGEGLGLECNMPKLYSLWLRVWGMSSCMQPTRKFLLMKSLLKSLVDITLCVGCFFGSDLNWSLIIGMSGM